jgi:integrase
VTFVQAADAYIAWRNPQGINFINVERLKRLFDNRLVRDIAQADIVNAANAVLSGRHPATKNRHIVRPAAAILHYAACNGWRDWLRIKKFKEPEPKTRYVTTAHEEWLLMATENHPDRHLLILWLFRQGDRISDALATRYEDCDLTERVLVRHINKTDRTVVLPLDDEICDALVLRQKSGTSLELIFPWRTRWGVRRWLLPLTRRLEIEFTPHRARHTLGKRLSETGARLRVIMDTLGHRDSKSSLRYQRGDLDTIRAAKSAAFWGKNGGKA